MKVYIFDLLAYGQHFEQFKADRYLPYPLPRLAGEARAPLFHADLVASRHVARPEQSFISVA
jgi:hypothetical protein